MEATKWSCLCVVLICNSSICRHTSFDVRGFSTAGLKIRALSLQLSECVPLLAQWLTPSVVTVLLNQSPVFSASLPTHFSAGRLLTTVRVYISHLLGRITYVAYDVAYCHTCNGSACLSVINASPAKPAERIEMLFATWIRGDPRNHV